jgi:hypothetical protein
MNGRGLEGWDRLRHGGLLLDPPRLSKLSEYVLLPIQTFYDRELRRFAGAVLDDSADVPEFVSFVLQKICGFTSDTGAWRRGNQIGPEWNRRAITGEAVKPRQLWQGPSGGILPVFIDKEKRLGIGRGRRATSQVLQWLRAGSERLALLTNGRQWRLIFTGLDFDAWCEWDVDLWFEEGDLSPQISTLRTLISPRLWTPVDKDSFAPLLQAILDSRKGQAELSAVLGERVREAVEILVQAHGEVLKERCSDIDPADIYRAAVRLVMRLVVILFAESRELLPRENALYHSAYGLTGLLEELEKAAARGGQRLARSWSAWPRVLALFHLVHQGSHHQALTVPAYGGELFASGNALAGDALGKVLSVFEKACFEREIFSDKEVLRLLERITRTRVKLRQGRSSTWVTAPVDFSDLSSEYIGILYEGLLDFELRTASPGDPVVFLSVGNQPALPLSRLEAMDDRAIGNLLEKMRDTSRGEDTETEGETEEGTGEETADEGEAEEEPETDFSEATDNFGNDDRQVTRTRAETWARKAVVVGKLARTPRGTMTPEKRLVHEEVIARKARQLVTKVVLPGEWYLVRWGGTRKGAGTFYTRPGLAVPTVQRTLRPLVFDPPLGENGEPDLQATPAAWTPKKPEAILALKVCDLACGSGTFPVAAQRFLTDALFLALHYHVRLQGDIGRPLTEILGITPAGQTPEDFKADLLPCRPEDDDFEKRAKAVLRRYVVERCIYGVDLDPLAVELCRLSLWIETMDRELPFSFLDHKIKCGNSLVGAWFDQFLHYPVMAWKNREGGDKNHANGVHFGQEIRTKAIKAFVKEVLTPDLQRFLQGKTLFEEDFQEKASKVHDDLLTELTRLHDLPVQDSAERGRIYREELIGSEGYQLLKAALDLWCACWFWPAEELEHAPLPTTLAQPSPETRAVANLVAANMRFFHWELEFPDVFRTSGSGFDAMLGNPPWDIAKPSSKEFFSNIDPLYRSYGKQEAIRYQSDYFVDQQIELGWLDYSSDFRAQSNFMGYAASPFGDPLENDKSSDRFAIQRAQKNEALHALWRNARKKSHGFADPAHPYRYQGSADINLYKLFLEQTYSLLRQRGRLGFIVPSGLYSDHGTGGLRRLFLDQCRWEWIFGFENREGIFEIHKSYKFNPIIVEKGGITESINTAFMRRNMEDWERAEALATPYGRAQVERFSPRSKSILEIQSQRDIEILEKIYSNSVLLGEEGPDGWGIKYAREFDMTNDSKLFPPRPKWEAEGYRPDEYSRWLKGDWRPIGDLWSELGIDPSKVQPLDPELEKSLSNTATIRTPWKIRCAQPPYDALPIPRADIPNGIILSREADAWIKEDGIEDIALPLYEGRMIGHFDFSQKGWVSGKGRSAKWCDIPFTEKRIEPQYCMARKEYLEANNGENREKNPYGYKLAFMDVASATNERTMIATVVPDMPCGNSVPILNMEENPWILVTILNSLIYDFVSRRRCSGLHLNYFVIEDSPLPRLGKVAEKLGFVSLRVGGNTPCFSDAWLRTLNSKYQAQSIKSLWGGTENERRRQLASVEAITIKEIGLDIQDLMAIIYECDKPVKTIDEKHLIPNGFWRIDKGKDPELRHTILTLIAFLDVDAKIRECEGDRDKGIEAFLNQNNGEGWMLPETLRLTDYGLGHDERANEPQPVASRLGPRFYDWQLAQSPEESWRECHLHARNLLGKSGYLNLLGEVLEDTTPGNWSEALALACELAKKENLLTVFALALGALSPSSWPSRLEEAKTIMSERSFPFTGDDDVPFFYQALTRVPHEIRSEGLGVLQQLLDNKDYLTVIGRLLSEQLNYPDGPWHILAREHLGEEAYRGLIADLEAKNQGQVAEPAAPYGEKSVKMVQRRLF